MIGSYKKCNTDLRVRYIMLTYIMQYDILWTQRPLNNKFERREIT